MHIYPQMKKLFLEISWKGWLFLSTIKFIVVVNRASPALTLSLTLAKNDTLLQLNLVRIGAIARK